jgi:putative transposase
MSGSENQAAGTGPEDAGELRVLGIDYAMQGLAVFSDGTRADYPGYYRKGQERLGKEQRKLSRCKKGSRNYEKQRRRVAKCHRKIRNQRNDYQHKLSREIAERYDAVAVEDIDMKAMSRGLHFGKSVMDNGFGALRDKLAYKLEKRGKRLIKVDRFYPSSKRCSCCGQVKKELGLGGADLHLRLRDADGQRYKCCHQYPGRRQAAAECMILNTRHGERKEKEARNRAKG